MSFLFESTSPVTLPITNSHQQIPVRRIYCVGQNYASHAKEMGSQVSQERPFFFIKSPFDITPSGTTIDYPSGTENLHFELELVVVIGKKLFNADEKTARQSVSGLAVGLDLTRRDMQLQLKSKSHPWALSKSFSHSAIISAVTTNINWQTLYTQSIILKQNGIIKQQAKLAEMTRHIEILIVYLSTLDRLYPGDIIFTGTPSGVDSIKRGDTLQGEISTIGEITLNIR
ncbi:MAG: fumarylacetoacetate hydrolase family protein [Ostreibacterium sp.]